MLTQKISKKSKHFRVFFARFLQKMCLKLKIIVEILFKKWQMQKMKLSDERTKMINEILNGIKSKGF